MQKPLISLALAAAALVCSLPVLAMTDSEYYTQKQRVQEDFSHRFVNCVDYSGSKRRSCEYDIRKERNAALKELKASYKSTREETPRSVAARP